MKLVLGNLGNSDIHQSSVSVQANLRMQVKPRSGGRSQNACNCALVCTENMANAEVANG